MSRDSEECGCHRWQLHSHSHHPSREAPTLQLLSHPLPCVCLFVVSRIIGHRETPAFALLQAAARLESRLRSCFQIGDALKIHSSCSVISIYNFPTVTMMPATEDGSVVTWGSRDYGGDSSTLTFQCWHQDLIIPIIQIPLTVYQLVLPKLVRLLQVRCSSS